MPRKRRWGNVNPEKGVPMSYTDDEVALVIGRAALKAIREDLGLEFRWRHPEERGLSDS